MRKPTSTGDEFFSLFFYSPEKSETFPMRDTHAMASFVTAPDEKQKLTMTCSFSVAVQVGKDMVFFLDAHRG